MSDIDSFKASVESFISERDWTPTRFGREIAGDPLFVFDLREGREPRSETRQRIVRAMQVYASGEGEEMRPLRIGIAGLGTVGAALIRILTEDGDAIARKLAAGWWFPPFPPGPAHAIVASISRHSNGLTIPWLWRGRAISISMSN